MRAVLSGFLLRHHDVADLAGVRPRCHFKKSVGEIRRTDPSKIGVGLVHGGIGQIVVGAVDAAEFECHGSPSPL
jgi:hypothetical protein